MVDQLDCYMAFRYTASGACKVILASLDRSNPVGNGTAVTAVFPESTQDSVGVINYMSHFFKRTIDRAQPQRVTLFNGETAGRESLNELLSYAPFSHDNEGKIRGYIDYLLRTN